MLSKISNFLKDVNSWLAKAHSGLLAFYASEWQTKSEM
jgi:hypothetical protein